MPLPKGAKKDPATGLFVLPEGHLKKSDLERAKLRKPTTETAKTEDRFNAERKGSRNISYRIFAVWPSGKYYLQDTLEPSLQFIANNFGGGRYEVWKLDATTGEYSGDPVPYNVDPLVYPPKGGDPMQGGRPVNSHHYSPFGIAQQQQPQGAGYYGAPALPVGSNDDELDELEDEIASLKTQLLAMTRERDEAKLQNERDRAEAARKESEARMLAMFADLKSSLNVAPKDSLQQLIEFKRIEGELNGGVIGKQGPADTITMALGLMNTIMAAAKSIPQESGGNAFDTVVRMADRYLPMIAKMAENNPAKQPIVFDSAAPPAAKAQPAPAPAAPPAPQPAPPVEVENFEIMIEALPQFLTPGTEAGYAEFVSSQTGAGWPEVQEVIRTEKPEGFLDMVIKTRPNYADTEEKKKSILLAISAAQSRLLELKAQ